MLRTLLSRTSSGWSSAPTVEGADLVAWVVAKLSSRNAKRKPTAGELVFTRRDHTKLSLPELIARVQCTMNPSDKAFEVALCLLLRLCSAPCSSQPLLQITPRTGQLALFACLVVATKFLEDHVRRMSYFAEVAAVPLPQLLDMEWFVLRSLDFHTFVSENELVATIVAASRVWRDAKRPGRTFQLTRNSTANKLDRALARRCLE